MTIIEAFYSWWYSPSKFLTLAFFVVYGLILGYDAWLIEKERDRKP